MESMESRQCPLDYWRTLRTLFSLPNQPLTAGLRHPLLPVFRMNQPDAIQQLLIASLADGRTVSGSELAQRLGISRAAVWKRMQNLRELGLPVSAHAGVGYRLPHAIVMLDAVAIRDRLSVTAVRRIRAVDVTWQLASTNSALMHQTQLIDDSSAVALLAEVQTGGRGRRGRAWRSNLGGSLTLSLRWRFEIGMSALAGLSLVAGIAAIKGLEKLGIGALALKWPNDLIAADRKLAGILIELGGEAQGPCHAVIGIGINVALDATTAAGIDQDWTDLATLDPDHSPIDRNALAAAVLSELAESLEQFEREGLAAFIEEQARYDALLGRQVQVHSPSGDRSGIACGVDARGALRVRDDAGEFFVESGEVSVRAE